MAKVLFSDWELYKFCLWRNRVFRNHSSAYSLKGIIKSYFDVYSHTAEKILDRLVYLGYAEYIDEENIKINI